MNKKKRINIRNENNYHIGRVMLGYYNSIIRRKKEENKRLKQLRTGLVKNVEKFWKEVKILEKRKVRLEIYISKVEKVISSLRNTKE